MVMLLSYFLYFSATISSIVVILFVCDNLYKVYVVNCRKIGFSLLAFPSFLILTSLSLRFHPFSQGYQGTGLHLKVLLFVCTMVPSLFTLPKFPSNCFTLQIHFVPLGLHFLIQTLSQKFQFYFIFSHSSFRFSPSKVSLL